MGRPNKPSAVKDLAGNPGKRATNKQEPDPDYLQDLSPPDWLPDGAKEIWRLEVPRLARAKLATVVDVRALSMACVAWWQYELAVERLKSGAGPLKGDGMSPMEQVRSMNFKQALAIFDRFGMTPRSRAQIQVQPQALLPLFDQDNADGKKAATGEDYFH